MRTKKEEIRKPETHVYLKVFVLNLRVSFNGADFFSPLPRLKKKLDFFVSSGRVEMSRTRGKDNIFLFFLFFFYFTRRLYFTVS